MWPTRIDIALDWLSFYFDKAVDIICQDAGETLCLNVRKIPHVKRFHSLHLAGPNDCEQPLQSRSIGLAFDLTVYS